MAMKLIAWLLMLFLVSPLTVHAQPFHPQPRPMHICPSGQTWQNGCIKWAPAKPGQLFGACIQSGFSCKRAPEQIQ